MGYIRLAWNTFICRIRYIGLLNYIPDNKQKAIEFLELEFGWRRYEAKHVESIFTRFFQGFLLPSKFGMDKRRPHFSGLIVSGQMSRRDAMTELEKPPYSKEKATEVVNYIKHKFNLTDQEFDEILKLPVKQISDYPNSEWFIEKFRFIYSYVKRIVIGKKSLKLWYLY